MSRKLQKKRNRYARYVVLGLVVTVVAIAGALQSCGSGLSSSSSSAGVTLNLKLNN